MILTVRQRILQSSLVVHRYQRHRYQHPHCASQQQHRGIAIATTCDLRRVRYLRRQNSYVSTTTTTAPDDNGATGQGEIRTDDHGTVPIIDLSLPIEEVGKDLHEACTTVGFFHLVNHGVSEQLRADVLSEARRLFIDLTPQQKESFSVEYSDSYRGYQRIGVNITGEQRDGHEGFDIVSESKRAIRRPAHPDGITNYGHNLWPDPLWLPSLRPTVEQYVTEMNAVGMTLLQAASLGLGLHKDYFLPFFEDPYWSMRLIRYPPASPPPRRRNKSIRILGELEEHSDPTQEEEEEEKGDSTYEYGVGRHTDYGVFTMILCDDVEDTLQILPKTKPAKAALLSTRGTEDDRLLYQEHWLNVDPIPGGFVCNIGDMLARWTNGIYMSTPHRALRPRTQDRISVPFFFDPSYDALISPIDELVNRQSDHRPQRPSFDEPIMYGDHLLAKTSKNFQV